MKRIITLALVAASTIATASPAMLAPRLYVAVELPSPAACGYSHIRAAIIMRELAPKPARAHGARLRRRCRPGAPHAPGE